MSFIKNLAALCLVLNLVLLASARGAPGDLDTSFGGTGKLRFSFGGGTENANAVAVQADGKVVMAGYAATNNVVYSDFAVVRFDTNNVLDNSFGNGGKVVTVLNSGSGSAGAYANAVKIQGDGKIVAAGFAYHDTNYNSFALVRYNVDGSLDTSFGAGGKVFTDFGQFSQINAMQIQFDGEILVAGHSSASKNPGQFALARYLTNGVLDTTFGSGGKALTDANGGAGAYGLMIQSDGKIVAAGTGGSDFAVLRYTTNGVLDTTFGGGTGKVFTRVINNGVSGPRDAAATSLATQFGNDTLQDPDEIVVAGYAQNASSHYVLAVVRYNLDGSLDTTYGGTGVVTNSFGSGAYSDFAAGVVVQAIPRQQRKVVIGGYSQDATGTSFAMARFLQNGTLDTTFGTNGTGKVTFDFGAGNFDAAFAMTVQNGNFLLAGTSTVNVNNRDFAGARFNSSGVLDATFGNGGVITADIADRTSHAQGVAIQPDGKVVMAGYADNGVNDIFALARCNPDGSFDNSFGLSGKVKTTLGSGDAAYAVAIQPDGKIVAVGNTKTGANQNFAVVRYNTNGVPDSSFGGTGVVITPIGASNDLAHAVTFQPDGKILVAGYSYNGANNDFALARYNANGTLDTTLAGSGKVTTAISSGEDQAFAVGVQSDGKIVVGGFGTVGSTIELSLVRYTTNGVLDSSFGSFGRVAVNYGAGNPGYCLAMVIQPDGKIVASGPAIISGTIYFGLMRFNTNGTLDSSFGTSGKVTTQVGLVSDYGQAMALQPDGKIVVAGLSQIGAKYQYAVLRYNPDGSLDTSYGSGGKVIQDFADGGDDQGVAMALDSSGRAVVAGDANGRFGVLRLTGDPILKILSVGRLPNGHALVKGIGVPGGGHTLLGSATLRTNSFSTVGPVTADGFGSWQYDDPTATNVNIRFYRLSYP